MILSEIGFYQCEAERAFASSTDVDAKQLAFGENVAQDMCLGIPEVDYRITESGGKV